MIDLLKGITNLHVLLPLRLISSTDFSEEEFSLTGSYSNDRSFVTSLVDFTWNSRRVNDSMSQTYR